MAENLYLRDLIDPSSIRIRRSISGGRELPETVTLELSDADGTYTALTAGGEDPRGKRVKIDVLDANEASSDQLRTLLYPSIYDYEIDPGKTARFDLRVTDPDHWQSMYPTLAYDPLASPWADADNGTTIRALDYHKGRFFSIPFGHAKKVPLVYVQYNSVADAYDYVCAGPCEATNSDKGTKVIVYRANRVINTDEYTVYSGGAGDPYPGYFTIRFTREQRSGSGNYFEITADIYGLTMGGATAQRNPVSQLEYFLEDTTWGKSLSLNSDSFTASAALVADWGGDDTYPVYCDGYISEQRSLLDIVDLWTKCCFSYLREDTTDGSIEIITDGYSATAEASFGNMDPGGYENIIANSFRERTIASDSATRTLTLRYRLNTWTGGYTNSLDYAVNTACGQDQEVEFWNVRDHRSIDLIGCYYRKLEQNTRRRFVLTTGMEGRFLEVHDPIDVDFRYQDEDGNEVTQYDGLLQTKAVDAGQIDFAIEAWPHVEDTYNYDEHASFPADSEVDDDLPDYTFTPPTAPTSLTITTSSTRQGTDGTTYAYYRLTAVAPTVNCKYLQFGYKQKNEAATNFHWVDGTESGTTWYATLEGLIPGQLYYFAARGVNPDNDQTSVYGAISTLTNTDAGYTAPGDTLAPATVSWGSGGATARTGKTIELDWDDNSEDDFSKYLIYRNTVNNSGTATKIAEADVSKFTDTVPSYTTYYYWLKAKDYTGNPSAAFSDVKSATASQLSTGDYGDDSVTSDKVLTIGWSQVTDVLIYGDDIGISAGHNLTIAAGGQIIVNATNGIQVSAGSDILMQAASGNPSVIYFQSGASHGSLIGVNYDSSILQIIPEDDGYCSLYLGTTAQTWNVLSGRAKSISLTADTTTLALSANTSASFGAGTTLQLSGGTSVTLTAATNYSVALSSSGLYSAGSNMLNLGTTAAPWAALHLHDGSASYWKMYGAYQDVTHGYCLYFTYGGTVTAAIDQHGNLWSVANGWNW